MRVCDICAETPLDDEKVSVTFYVTMRVGEYFIAPPHGHSLLKLYGNYEICPDCCKMLQKFFKGGGEPS